MPGPLAGDLIFNFVGVSFRKFNSGQTEAAGGLCNEILISLAPEDLVLMQTSAIGSNFSVPISTDPSVVGLFCFCQAGDMDVTGNFRLTNAIDVVIGF